MRILLLLLLLINLLNAKNLWLACEKQGKKFYFNKNINAYVCKSNREYNDDKQLFEQKEAIKERKKFDNYLKQAQSGNITAYPKVAIMYFYGIGTSINKDSAVYWFNKLNIDYTKPPKNADNHIIIERFDEDQVFHYESSFAAIISYKTGGRYYKGYCESETYFFDKKNSKIIGGELYSTTTGLTLFHGYKTCYSD